MREANPAVEKAANYLDQIPKFTKRKHTGEELRAMLSILHVPQKGLRFLHVAGTNGKGSVCAFLDSILREAGYRTAVFTSPHLISVKERFSFSGSLVSDERFLRAFKAVKQSIPSFEAAGLGHPSYFESLFFMFMRMVSEAPPDYVILETGLGGRLDATNCILCPELTIITSISLDHTEYLGDTVEQIAGEKAGILKPQVPVIYDNTSPEASKVIEARARLLKCPAWPVDLTFCREAALENGHIRAVVAPALHTESCCLDIPFAAGYQVVNALLAFRAAMLLGIGQAAVCRGIKRTVWPGRMEEIQKGLYLDGAHNEGGIREFARAAGKVAKERGGGRRILLFAVASDKEYEKMAELLKQELAPDLWLLTRVQYSRGLELSRLEETVKQVLSRDAGYHTEEAGREEPASKTQRTEKHEAGKQVTEECKRREGPAVMVFPDTKTALQSARENRQPEDTIFCAGSLYLVGEVRDALRRESHE